MKFFLLDAVPVDGGIKLSCLSEESHVVSIIVAQNLPKLYMFLSEEAWNDPDYELKLHSHLARNCGVQPAGPLRVKEKPFLDLQNDIFHPSLKCCVVRYRGRYRKSSKIFSYLTCAITRYADAVERFLITSGITGWFLLDEEDTTSSGNTLRVSSDMAKNIIPCEGEFPAIRLSYMEDASGDLHVGYRCGVLDLEPLTRQLCHDIRDFERPFDDFAEFVRTRRLLEVAQGIRELTCMPFRLVGSPMKRVEWMIMRRLRTLKIVVRSRAVGKEEQALEGGMVLDPRIGYHLGVRVVEFDFFAHYPSVCVAHDIDIADGCVLPVILREALRRRKEEPDPHVRVAIKLLSNTVYGAMANPYCRFFCLRVAQDITRLGRETLGQAVQIAARYGCVVYGDTDSFFLMGDFDSDKLLEEIHATLRPPIRLEKEHEFASIIIVTKKNYLGLTSEGEKIIKMNFLKRKDYAPFNLDIAAQVADVVLSGSSWERIEDLLSKAAHSYKENLDFRAFVMIKKAESASAARSKFESRTSQIAYIQSESGPVQRAQWNELVHKVDRQFYRKQLCSIMDQLLSARSGYDPDFAKQLLLAKETSAHLVPDPYVFRGTTHIRCSVCDNRFKSVGMRELQKKAELVPHQCLRFPDVMASVDLWCSVCRHVARQPLPQLLDFEIEYTAYQFRDCTACSIFVVKSLFEILSSKSRKV